MAGSATYNSQVATATTAWEFVGDRRHQKQHDEGQAAPMLDAIATRCGTLPSAFLTVGGSVNRSDITDAAERGVQTLAKALFLSPWMSATHNLLC